MSLGTLAMKALRRSFIRDDPSPLSVDEAVERLQVQAKALGWRLPHSFDLQEFYARHGPFEMNRVMVIYLCDPPGGYALTRPDAFKPLLALMPSSVCIYETSRGEVRVTRFNYHFMARMFGGKARQTLHESGDRMDATLAGIVS